MNRLWIVVADTALEAEWTEANPSTRDAIAAALPVAGQARRWGDELYLPIEVDSTPASTQERVLPGSVAYWPAGPALCIFWGPTPASTDDQPRAASPVAVIAEIVDYDALAAIDGGAHVRFEGQSNRSS